MNMAFGIKQNIIWLHISMYNTLSVNVSKCTAQLCHPKPHTIVGEGFARNVKAKITAIHQVYHEVAVRLLAIRLEVD